MPRIFLKGLSIYDLNLRVGKAFCGTRGFSFKIKRDSSIYLYARYLFHML